MSRTNDEIVSYWTESVRQYGLIGRPLVGGTVRVNADGAIHYERRANTKRTAWGPVVLGRYVKKSKAVVLNGDGFNDQSGTNWQTRLRNNVRMRLLQAPSKHVKQMVVIPYAALTAAEIDIESIIPIHVITDENEEIFTKRDAPPDQEAFPDGGRNDYSTRVRTLTRTGITYELFESRDWGYTNGIVWQPNRPAATVGWRRELNPEWGAADINRRYRLSGDGQRQAWMLYIDNETLSRLKTQREAHNRTVATNGWGLFTVGEFPTEDGWYTTEMVHHLGACLFSALGEDGKRHKFVSAFDEDEPARMYFLAQLPDGSGATTYQEALDALAPPFVHEARKRGRRVFRQGDVFAVETTLSDEEVYSFAKTRVRREIVYSTINAQTVRAVMGGLREWPEPGRNEVRERIACPCKCGHKRWSGSSPKARAALSIYNTGHTADEVVVSAKGTTYVRGTLYHDPHVYEPGRQREHQDIALPPGVWFVAVRNTVPRRRRRAQQAQPAVEATAS